VKEIPLTNSSKMLQVDDSKYDAANQIKWCINNAGYAFSTNRPYVSITVFLFGKPPIGNEWDHKDGNCLNNQESNVRLATRSQNKANQGKQGGVYSSQYKGVTWLKSDKRWRASIKVNGKVFGGGQHVNEEDAARAYDKLALEHFGEFAVLNLPNKREVT
jgi:hypothetical protein